MVGLCRAYIVRIALHRKLQARIGLHHRDDLIDERLRIGLDGRLASVEIDVQRDATVAVERRRHVVRRDDRLLHAGLLPEVQLVVAAAVVVQLHPALRTVLDLLCHDVIRVLYHDRPAAGRQRVQVVV